MTVSLVGSSGDAGFEVTNSVVVPAGAVIGDLVVILASTSRYPQCPDPATIKVDEFFTGGGDSLDVKGHLFVGTVGSDGIAPGGTVAVGEAAGSGQNRSAALLCFHSSTAAALLYHYGVASLAHVGSVSPQAPDIAAVADGILVFGINAGTATNAAFPGGYAEQQDRSRTAASTAVATKAVAAGQTGTATATITAAAWHTLHLLVYEAVAGPSATHHVYDGAAWVDRSSRKLWDGTAWTSVT